MNEQERKIIKLLLNEMAFEGAMKHFNVPHPVIADALLEEIQNIEIPKRYDGTYENYEYETLEFPENWSVFQRCYKCLRIVRNNIIHANKAAKPDTPERLTDLLDWCESFIRAVYETDSQFARQAKAIKEVMQIESF